MGAAADWVSHVDPSTSCKRIQQGAPSTTFGLANASIIMNEVLTKF